MTPAERDCFALVVMRICRSRHAFCPYRAADDVDAVEVRPDLGGALTGPRERKQHRHQAFQILHERRS